MSTHLQKFTVCQACLSVGITSPDCICCYSNSYPTIELEFKVCDCCGHVIHEEPADTEFNRSKLPKESA